MMKLSVVIITFNEEKNIERCLKSIQSVADDIVVVDSFSKDQTRNICEQYNIRFIEHAFDGHIEQKNWAITQAKHRHILSLDADEVLSPRLIASILEIKKNGDYDGYKFNRLNNYCGQWIKHGGWYPDTKLRLWDSRKGYWQGENPHDEYRMEAGAKIKKIKGNLLHYSYYSIKGHLDQMNKFTEIAAHAAVQKGKTSNLCKILIRPFWRFIRDYFFKAGFLDGYYGFVIAIISSHTTFIKYIKIRDLQKRENK